jgi:tRNA pseudouridine-54 N-methylase
VLARDSKDALSVAGEIRRHVAQDKANKRANSSEPGVARSRGIETLVLQMLQKGEDRIW